MNPGIQKVEKDSGMRRFVAPGLSGPIERMEGPVASEAYIAVSLGENWAKKGLGSHHRALFRFNFVSFQAAGVEK
jgi:hypothetical protein